MASFTTLSLRLPSTAEGGFDGSVLVGHQFWAVLSPSTYIVRYRLARLRRNASEVRELR
jgi:hypothetical protein